MSSRCAWLLAHLYDDAGGVDKAFEWLERAYAHHNSNVPHLDTIQYSEESCSDPRYGDLLLRMNLPA